MECVSYNITQFCNPHVGNTYDDNGFDSEKTWLQKCKKIRIGLSTSLVVFPPKWRLAAV